MIIRDVVKVGGSLAREPERLGEVMRTLAGLNPLPLVVPGGGALADAVRALHARGGVSEETAHRMALLALDAMALWMAELADEPPVRGAQVEEPPVRGARAAASDDNARLGRARVVRDEKEIRAAVASTRLPVLAPSAWLAREEPLPASWRVTSDAIAAWVAGRLGARRLILVKSFALRAGEVALEELGDAVDDTFGTTWPADVECRLVEGAAAPVASLLNGGGGGTLVRRDHLARAPAHPRRDGPPDVAVQRQVP